MTCELHHVQPKLKGKYYGGQYTQNVHGTMYKCIE